MLLTRIVKPIFIDAAPEVLKWLRVSSGCEIEDVKKRLGTTTEIILELETGKRKPTLNQLKTLSKMYRRPLASFLLSEPKSERPTPKDLRYLPGRTDKFDKKTILAIRKARNLQNIGRELSLNVGYDTSIKIGRAWLTNDPERVATAYRHEFSFSLDKQKKFTAYEMFGYLRGVLEDMNILTFHFPMAIEDARGFALADETPNVIVVNSMDSIEARLFTMIHEFGHILLGETVIDLPGKSLILNNGIEAWCDAFSASFFLPAELAKDLFVRRRESLTKPSTLNSLSERYKVSKAVLLVRMLNLNFIDIREFKFILARRVPEEMKIETEKAKKVTNISADRRCISEMGTKFVSLVANNFDKEFITYDDALSYLSVKSKNFDKVLARVRNDYQSSYNGCVFVR